ncbi:tRNA uridine-5-carboxymethylaminomethyl(34) synthesis GTPase MnmE [Coprobacter sp.]
MLTNDTICAVSTAPGVGGIAVIRISGKDAVSIASCIYKPFRKNFSLTVQKPYTLSYGEINDEYGKVIDEVVVALFATPHSFTGEDIVEISCHGSLYIQQQIIALLIHNGCRSALPGEFTQRAFANGKMDLSQAEAVADLIASTSAATHRLALNQMRGGFSNELVKLRTRLLDFASLIELELDFSEEEVEFADRSRLIELAIHIESVIRKLAESFKVGNAIKNGIPTAIIGETNAGKSTLLNSLLHEDRALVSDIHGTTRDVIEDTTVLQGITFRFIDTAGIRDTQDKIESMGIELTFRKLEQAAIVLWMIDATELNENITRSAGRIIQYCKEKKLIVLLNKTDKLTRQECNEKKELVDSLVAFDHSVLCISAKNNFGIEELEQQLVAAAALPETGTNDVIVTNVRHYEALLRAQKAISRVLDGLHSDISGDFLAQDIRECMHYLGEITGQISTDEILGNIFSKFCIGK